MVFDTLLIVNYTCCVLQRWKDDYLIWNPDDYGGVVSVKMSYEKIWIPDVMLYNTYVFPFL